MRGFQPRVFHHLHWSSLPTGIVSGKSRRYKQGGYDLDLAYITDSVIAMSYPFEGRRGGSQCLPRELAYLYACTTCVLPVSKLVLCGLQNFIATLSAVLEACWMASTRATTSCLICAQSGSTQPPSLVCKLLVFHLRTTR